MERVTPRVPIAEKKSGKRKLLLVVFAAVVLSAGAWVLTHRSLKSLPTAQQASQGGGASAPANPDVIRFIATGDMLPHDSVDANAKTATGYDYSQFFTKVQPYLTSADMSFCNQESPSDPSRPVIGYPTFNAPASFAEDLSKEGCNVINLANNHADDDGQAGINATRQIWSGLKTLAVAGTNSSADQQNQVATFAIKGVKFAFLSYAQCSNNRGVSSYGLNIFSESLAGRQIAAAKAQHVDMIIAAMHSCDENRSTEDNWQDQTAAYFASQGVDIVVGTGPHWLQPAKRLPKAGGGTTAVWFSLGNFLGTQLDVNGLIGGIAEMEINTKTKTVSSMGFMPTYMHYYWTASQKASNDLAARTELMIYPLDQATDAMAHSQDNTTVQVQTARVTQLMNMYTPVTMYTSRTFPH